MKSNFRIFVIEDEQLLREMLDVGLPGMNGYVLRKGWAGGDRLKAFT